ncbi:metallophosphoesterase [Paenibacillus baekrokdamisoli]|uniref:Metallophosphoesterase n=1 Tax=Paenibacillus baekrokdamisoli TaxID=1712516 RepID=A0A3G9JFD8_9BACL|nr:metallophosphoesterase [Paenibacillus baekrokdamisoli]MBB3071616.1 hypothetical protein [Paenibacillus baekrokdamisoli]BBH21874.1 metallophosphoesterase [Paenibacillus baekrokdamisoli]
MKYVYKRSAFIKILLILMILVSGTLYYYARHIEPNLLHVRYQTIRSSSVTKDLDGIRILQFSDLHLGPFYSLAELKQLVKRINELHPDLVVFTGDLVDNFAQYPTQGSIAPILKQIQAPLGKYAVYGNHDQGGGGKQIYRRLLADSNFVLLVNEQNRIRIQQSELTIVGLDDFLLGSPNIKKAFQHVPEDGFTLLLAHEPDIADRVRTYPIDLQLSGHSHGGQVRLPWFGSLYTPPLARKYREGLYRIVGARKPMTLYVNRGIGITRLPFRFSSVPELAVFTLQHEAS